MVSVTSYPLAYPIIKDVKGGELVHCYKCMGRKEFNIDIATNKNNIERRLAVLKLWYKKYSRMVYINLNGH